MVREIAVRSLGSPINVTIREGLFTAIGTALGVFVGAILVGVIMDRTGRDPEELVVRRLGDMLLLGD